MRSKRGLFVGTVISLTAILGLGGGLAEPSQQPEPMICGNFPLAPTVLIVTPRGGRFDLDWAGNFVRFPIGAVADTARYRIARVMQGDAALMGISLDPIGGSPSGFRRPVHIRLDYTRCRPSEGARPRKLLQSDGQGGPWVEVDSSGPVPGQLRAVSGYIDHLTAFAIAR